MKYEVAETAVVYPDTVIGEGCRIGDHSKLAPVLLGFQWFTDRFIDTPFGT